jgi:protein-tyrosine phosphatase
VRDVGGLPTVDGRRTRSGVLVRADNLQGLTERDVARLVGELGVRSVIDLRTDGERRLEGPTPLDAAGVVAHGLSLVPERPEDSAEQAVDRAVGVAVDPEAPVGGFDRAIPRPERRGRARNDMAGYYVGYVEDAPDNLARALRLLADPASGPTVVHCAAGKDRTGTVVALALSLAGVTRDAVVADYVASAERVEAVLARLRASPTYAHDLEGATADDVRPVAASMEGFLDQVDQAYGGPHGLALAIGVDEETVERLVRRLVGPSPHGAPG